MDNGQFSKGKNIVYETRLERYRGGDISPCWAGWYVTMNPKGLIAMTRPTYERMDAPKGFVVLWDSVNNRIGLKPAALTTRNAYPVRVHSILGGKKINVNRLIKEARVSLPQTIRFYDADTDEDGLLILDLRTTKVSLRRERSKKQ